jgi:pyruvate/2-oxoglutarate/acetoin dehydrogenase E1 component/TPP-dependent pyruvate/acetoin dehydrogenase alpha subunit
MISTSLTDAIINSNSEYSDFKKEVLNDYFICVLSREASLLARKEVLTGKAKFGIIGDGKELPQVVMSKFFKEGDWRSGYYRDQTFMFAAGLSSIEAFYAQLYADVDNDPFSGGRQMNSHYATPLIDSNDNWLDSTSLKNVSSDVSCTGGQMARALGLALASKQYRERSVNDSDKFSENGNEISFVTIGDASTSEGVFWETMNAAAVMKVPLITCVWDDGYGISVPKELQTTKASISEALSGLLIDDNNNGIYIYRAKGWDYQDMCRVFEEATKLVRENHIPALIHIEELTQPQGHSTSGSHERYKSSERLTWEKDHDCIDKFKEWILSNNIASEEELTRIKEDAVNVVKEGKNNAWENYLGPVKSLKNELTGITDKISIDAKDETITQLTTELNNILNPTFGELLESARLLLIQCKLSNVDTSDLKALIDIYKSKGDATYEAHLYSYTTKGAINIPVVAPQYSEESQQLNGYQILNAYFDKLLKGNDKVIAFGEDVGHIGDVNQGFANMQEKHGIDRVFDTGIREWTIIGQGIGASMRGLRPIAEIQYLDYITYAFSPLTDDLATLRYRSNGIQQAPLIIRSRGHRLEGIWHAGSPLGVLINALRGICLCVPRNMVQAVGMYNTLVQSSDPGLVIECLNGYRLKETLPDNVGDYTVPLGSPEVLTQGSNLTIVTYGSCVRVVQKAVEILNNHDISVEIIDVQTLLPFDLEHTIVESIKKTNRVLFVDEDVPGGGTAYMMKKVLEDQKAYQYLDSAPATLTAKEHRTPFGSDGDYFTKPQVESVVEKVYEIMEEAGLV